jgi:hypothetical protein
MAPCKAESFWYPPRRKTMNLTEIRRRWPLLALFGFALFVRLFGLYWDQRHFFLPDERDIAMAVDRL